MTDENGGGRSIREMAEDAEPEEELFPRGSIDGDGLDVADVLRMGGTRREFTTSLMSGEVPNPGSGAKGFFDPVNEGILLVTYEFAGFTPRPIRKKDASGGRSIEGWKVVQQLRPIYIERAAHGEAADVEARFLALLKEDPAAAGALLDGLNKKLGKALATA